MTDWDKLVPPNSEFKQSEKHTIIYSGPNMFPEINGVKLFVDIGKYKNKVLTHDHYSNPNSHIYYECSCGAILDPGTRSFAQLNNVASDKGWKVRFSDRGHIPYCVKCGEGVE